MDLTVILPTRASSEPQFRYRGQFLARQLRYLQITKFPGVILITDGSEDADAVRNQTLVEELGESINILYYSLPRSTRGECLDFCMGMIKTKYACFVADDDFLVPSGLIRCVEFLEENGDYVCAHGVGIKITTQNDLPFGKILSVGTKQQPVHEENTGAKRFIQQGLHQTARHRTDLHFAVHRREIFQEAFKDWDLFEENFGARYLNFLVPILGKVKELDCLSLVRHMHDAHVTPQMKGDTFLWMRQNRWRDEYETISSRLATRLGEIDGISFDDAKSIIDLGYGYDFGARIIQEFNQNPQAEIKLGDQSSPFNVFKIIRKILIGYPGLLLRNILENSEGFKPRIELDSLRDERHPFHGDFMEIYHAVLGQ